MKDKKDICGDDVALQAFELMADFLGADTDVPETDDGFAEFERVKRKITTAIKSGMLTVDADGQPTLITQSGTEAAFDAPTGATLLARPPGKGTDGDDAMRKMFAVIADLTKGKLTPGKMRPKEVGVALAIATLFMSELA